jgi:hypothetical protein
MAAKKPFPRIRSFSDCLDYAEPRPAPEDTKGKGPYGTRLSKALAVFVANGLRKDFKGILPLPDGTRSESRARTAKGFKKLDVNHSTVELGLALGVSIKTINYRDPETKRYTKNYSRIDNELRAEAMDYHQRQPFSVLVGLLFLPIDAAEDSGKGKGEDAKAGLSSFAAAVKYFRTRSPRESPRDDLDLFEGFYIGLYGFEDDERGEVVFFDVAKAPPRNRRPTPQEVLSYEEVLERIRDVHDSRNNPPFEWAD